MLVSPPLLPPHLHCSPLSCILWCCATLLLPPALVEGWCQGRDLGLAVDTWYAYMDQLPFKIASLSGLQVRSTLCRCPARSVPARSVADIRVAGRPLCLIAPQPASAVLLGLLSRECKSQLCQDMGDGVQHCQELDLSNNMLTEIAHTETTKKLGVQKVRAL